MKTNFEKWRDSLTPEDVLKGDDNSIGALYFQIERWRAFPVDFLRWANAPAKEEE